MEVQRLPKSKLYDFLKYSKFFAGRNTRTGHSSQFVFLIDKNNKLGNFHIFVP